MQVLVMVVELTRYVLVINFLVTTVIIYPLQHTSGATACIDYDNSKRSKTNPSQFREQILSIRHTVSSM